ncbi:recombinase family protein [Mycobacterium pseudokansasii]|uniref:DNA-invertase hin n=4 Tax=Mycobacterium TaxID=1763 RepID=A0A498QXW2_9MYCO|nr:recombinase family protein [Mycobacterium pseudokansasii]VBA55042.1 DNA-invertase hin [Mycobacterium pseudokansasii]
MLWDMGELLGYARVSTTEQSAQGQLDALHAAGVEQVWTDVASGLRSDRPALAELVTTAAKGDTVVVSRLDRLGRSLPELLALVEDLTSRGIGLRSLGEQIDTTSAAGRLVLHVFGALAEFERALMHERTMAGLAAARARGRVGGRPQALSGSRLTHARELQAQGMPVWEIAQLLGVGRSTAYRQLKAAESVAVQR